jgi:predicted nuclease of predicted toxin-antitoxin system
MKVLLDTCVWGGVVQALRNAGHDVIWAGEWDEDPGDDEILSFAHREGRILITLDKDFGELAVVYNRAHSGIIRLVRMSSAQQVAICLKLLDEYQAELKAGTLIVVDPDKIRIREK